jgi:hypothetical protein
VPARPGPRRAHKLTGEVVAFARERRAADPMLSSAGLVELIAERFGVRVHRRSVERALQRAEQTESEMTDGSSCRPGDIERYEQLRARARALGGEPSGWRLGLALLERRGVAAWARAWRSTAPAPASATAGPPAGPAAVGDELVGALASMALARVAAG